MKDSMRKISPVAVHYAGRAAARFLPPLIIEVVSHIQLRPVQVEFDAATAAEMHCGRFVGRKPCNIIPTRDAGCA